MTIEELKKEANKLGYSIIKKRKIPKMLTCTCGCNRRRHWSIGGTSKFNSALECKRCGKWVDGLNDIDVINNWNKMIKEEENKNE